AYAYDGFGHVVLTKACATDFGECDDRPEHVGPPELPFRITKVSYAPTEFSPPSGRGLITSLDYGPGRFPVVTTNSLNHREYSVYSLLNGSLRQKTGPNGITTCSWTDPFGQMVAETARCGSDAPLTTTTMTYRSVATDLPLAKLVTVTRTPAGDASWTYTDALGRKVATRKRAFDGRFIESGASYDPVGRPATESKAHFLGAPVFTVETH